ncbi:MAG: tRNA pseudouridine(13) synthase TruD [Planctomycetota bacterium]|jgi:tRNA pseudouridine13 synthase
MNLPYLTADLPGTGGVLKTTPEDFLVDEIPLYEACGEGEHVFAFMRKRGIATFEAVRRLAERLRIPERYITFAGLKDARAITSQWISLFDVTEEQVAAVHAPAIELSSIRRHRNRLRVGHLRGNRFSIVVREAEPGYETKVHAVQEVLLRRGVPNLFGEQRFGVRGDSYKYGECLLRGDVEGLLFHLLGGPPGPTRDPAVLESRRLYNEGDFKAAYDAMPIKQRIEKKALGALVRFGDKESAARAIPKRMRQIFISSYQSWLFNQVTSDRVDGIDRLEVGDMAYIHRTGRAFRVEDTAAEQPRCDAFEISPSGPIFGSRTTMPGGEPGVREQAVFGETGLTKEDFRNYKGLKLKGSRRSMRIPLRDFSYEPVDETSYRLRFALPSGSFATVVLRESMNNAG